MAVIFTILRSLVGGAVAIACLHIILYYKLMGDVEEFPGWLPYLAWNGVAASAGGAIVGLSYKPRLYEVIWVSFIVCLPQALLFFGFLGEMVYVLFAVLFAGAAVGRFLSLGLVYLFSMAWRKARVAVGYPGEELDDG